MSNLEKMAKEIDELAEIKKKKIENEKFIIEVKNKQIKTAQKEMEVLGKLNLDFSQSEYVDSIKKDMDDYAVAVKNSLVFINEDFRGSVPFCRKTLIFIGATTGSGKSTIAANLALQTITQKDSKGALVITNEEAKEDVFNRVTALIKGWSYTNHESITPDQWETYNKYVEILSHRMLVIDNNYGGNSQLTKSLEGIESILKKVAEDKREYGVIILDYYQNVEFSLYNKDLRDWDVQHKLAKMLDDYRKIIKAPIVVLGQLHNSSKDRASFKERIEGRKVILNAANVGIEVVAQKEDLRTDFIIHKNRFSEYSNHTVKCGFDRGKYVRFTPDFANKVELNKQKRATQNLMKKSGLDKGLDEEE